MDRVQWNGNFAWSGTVFVPCIFCMTAGDASTTPPLPKLKTLQPEDLLKPKTR